MWSQVGDTQSNPVPYSVNPARLSPAIAQKYRWSVQIAIPEPNKEASLFLIYAIVKCFAFSVAH